MKTNDGLAFELVTTSNIGLLRIDKFLKRLK